MNFETENIFITQLLYLLLIIYYYLIIKTIIELLKILNNLRKI